MPPTGLEPAPIKGPASKTGAATSYAKGAWFTLLLVTYHKATSKRSELNRHLPNRGPWVRLFCGEEPFLSYTWFGFRQYCKSTSILVCTRTLLRFKPSTNWFLFYARNLKERSDSMPTITRFLGVSLFLCRQNRMFKLRSLEPYYVLITTNSDLSSISSIFFWALASPFAASGFLKLRYSISLMQLIQLSDGIRTRMFLTHNQVPEPLGHAQNAALSGPTFAANGGSSLESNRDWQGKSLRCCHYTNDPCTNIQLSGWGSRIRTYLKRVKASSPADRRFPSIFS